MSFFKRIIEITTLDLHKQLPLEVLIKLLLTNIMSIIIMVAATIFVFVSLNNGAVYLAYFLLGLIIIHIFNFIIFFWKKNILLTEYIVVLSVEFLFLILIINGGNVGYGYLWFYGFPLISMFILGKRVGRLINLSFFLVLISLIFIPKHLFSNEYNDSLIFRIVISYFTISVVIHIILSIKEKVVSDLKRKLSNKNKFFEEKNKLFIQLSNESKNTFNNIINITNQINKTKSKLIQLDNLELLQNSTTNLINIMNNIVEITEYKIDTVEYNPTEFNLLKTIDNTIQIFNSKDFVVNLNYSEKIPNTIIGNPVRVKQVLYNVLNTITKHVNNKKSKIDINIELKSNKDSILNLRFKIKVNHNIIESDNSVSMIENKILLSSVNKYIEQLDLSYTNNLIVSSGGYMYINESNNNTVFKFSCYFNCTKSNKNELSNLLLKNSENDNNYDYLSDEQLKKFNILFVDDNFLNKKLGEIELRIKFNKIDFVNSYKEAIKKFTSSKFDIIIVNSRINNIVCDSFIRKVKEYEYGHIVKAKIIVIDTHDESINKSELMSYGITGFCDRNINVNSLLKIIRQNR